MRKFTVFERLKKSIRLYLTATAKQPPPDGWTPPVDEPVSTKQCLELFCLPSCLDEKGYDNGFIRIRQFIPRYPYWHIGIGCNYKIGMCINLLQTEWQPDAIGCATEEITESYNSN